MDLLFKDIFYIMIVMMEEKEIMKPRNIWRREDITRGEERVFMRYYSDGKYKSRSIIEFERSELWSNELTHSIMVELFNRALSKSDLNARVRNRMMRYLREEAMRASQDNPEEYMERLYIKVYNPYDSVVYLNKGLDELTVLDIVTCIKQDVSSENTYYGLTTKFGVDWVAKQFSYQYMQYKWLFDVLSRLRKKNKTARIPLLFMKWVERATKKIDQILCIMRQPITIQKLMSIMKMYYIDIEGEEEEIDDNELYQEVSMKIAKMMSIGAVTSSNNSTFVITDDASEIVEKMYREFLTLIKSLSYEYIVSIDESSNTVWITNTGAKIQEKMTEIYTKDLNRLKNPPDLINDLDFHEVDKPIPPIDILFRNRFRNLHEKRRLTFYLKFYKEFAFSTRTKRFIFTSGILSVFLVLGLVSLIIGVYNLFYGVHYAINFLIFGLFLLSIFIAAFFYKTKYDKYDYIYSKASRMIDLTNNDKRDLESGKRYFHKLLRRDKFRYKYKLD